MDTSARGISAREIGRRIGASAMEVNQLLLSQEFLRGEPGAYGLTSKGEQFGSEREHWNGYGGIARRSFETTHYDPAIVEALDLAPENLAKVRETITMRKQAQSAASQLARAEAEKTFKQLMASKEAVAPDKGIDPVKVLMVVAGVVVVVGVSYGIYRGVARIKRVKAERASE
ncbi:hypothetical protein [Frigoribacterium sp. CG_9.8]|uniref:hypothetical protein n=1 Tax=Frigoribacterium sp. CG_9.8 TaxID=2787733 RepID=UPI0018CAF8C7|nr:hypothetical protein [Frigoribacterium sp. CG_9.8]MBG6107384.1 hypothetical protein [Frigoribacterium sp. CG_9.8]